MVMWLLSVLVGVIAGAISGLGIGGGTILVLYLTAVLGMPASGAAGINLLYFLGCAPASILFHARHQLIDKKAALFASLGGAVTALLAALFVPTPSPEWLERLFGGLLLFVGFREAWLFFKERHTAKNSG